jgi:hypothetical protein
MWRPFLARLPARTRQEYAVRAPKQSRRVFVGRFPGGKPGLAAASAGSGWEFTRTEPAAGSAVPASLRLSGGAANAAFIGAPDGSQSAPYYLFMMRQEGVIDAIPSGPWFNFRPEMRARGALTLEEAEERMKARTRAGETAGSWLARAGGSAAATRALPPGGTAAPDGGEDSDSEAVRRGAGSESESEEDADAARKRRGRRGGASAADAAADGTAPPAAEGEGEGEDGGDEARDGGRRGGGGGGGGRDSPERGEDWEHEGAMTDDDEAAGVGDQIEEAEEAAAPPPAAGDAEAGAEGLDEAGRNMHRLLMAQRKGGDAAEEDEEEEEEGDLFEDDEARTPRAQHATATRHAHTHAHTPHAAREA